MPPTIQTLREGRKLGYMPPTIHTLREGRKGTDQATHSEPMMWVWLSL